MSVESTSINLLTRNGAVCATFTPALTSEQYDEILKVVQVDGNTAEELANLLKKLAAKWQRTLILDPC